MSRFPLIGHLVSFKIIDDPESLADVSTFKLLEELERRHSCFLFVGVTPDKDLTFDCDGMPHELLGLGQVAVDKAETEAYSKLDGLDDEDDDDDDRGPEPVEPTRPPGGRPLTSSNAPNVEQTVARLQRRAGFTPRLSFLPDILKSFNLN